MFKLVWLRTVWLAVLDQINLSFLFIHGCVIFSCCQEKSVPFYETKLTSKLFRSGKIWPHENWTQILSWLSVHHPVTVNPHEQDWLGQWILSLTRDEPLISVLKTMCILMRTMPKCQDSEEWKHDNKHNYHKSDLVRYNFRRQAWAWLTWRQWG